MRRAFALFSLSFLVLASAGPIPTRAQTEASSGIGAPAAGAPQTPEAQAAPPPPPAPPAPAVTGLSAETNQALARVGAGIEKAAQSVEDAKTRDDELARLRGLVDGLIAEAGTLASTVAPHLAAIRGQIDKLGPPPAKDAPPEAPAIAEERARLNQFSAEADGAIRKMELAQVRGRQIVARIQVIRQEIFTTDLFRRTKSPLSPSVWIDFGHEVSIAARDLGDVVRNWQDRVAPRLGQLFAVLGFGLVLFGGLHVATRRLIARRVQPPGEDIPSFFARAGSAVIATPLILAPGAVAAISSYLLLDGLDLLGLQAGALTEGALTGYLAYAGVAGLAVATLAPERCCWRLFDISDRTAKTLSGLIKATAAVYAVDIFLRNMSSTLSLSLHLAVVLTLVTSIAVSTLIVAIARTPLEPRTAQGVAVSRWRPRWFKLPLLALSIAVIAASLLGFVALGRFMVGQALLTASALLLLFLLHLAIRAAAAMPMETRLGATLDEQLGLGEARRTHLSTAIAVLLHIALAGVGLPLILLTWGFSVPDILDASKALVFGFEIGQFRISLARIAIALLLFGLILAGTRMVQRWLDSRVLPAAKLDAGVTNSVLTGLGYAGFAIAALVAVSYAGLDITNLAIVAGALSVGIGFGLQSIVNNFVSGLILLVERPVKVGDWIIVKDREGIVRRISVRSTEIETFDRASVIIPNSELITGTVMNWTHRNSVGRITIRVGVSYASDPERVLEILRDVAAANAHVLAHPAPIVTFENFGNSSLDFALRIFLADVTKSLAAQTELRLAIHKAFAQAGIEIPFPQTDVHLRDLDGVKAMVAQALAARQTRAATTLDD